MGETSVWVPEGTNQDREDFKYVGTWDHPGRQSWDMVSGAAKYPTDLWMDGTLTAMALRCPYGHAKVKSLDISEAEKMEGVKLVLTYEDEELASMPRYRPAYYQLGASPLLGDEAEFEGDEVGAVVVAVNEEVCKKALAAIKVDWEVLPFILDPREAAKPGAPILRPEMNPDSNMTGNTFGAAVEWELGCAEDGFKEADHIDVVNYGRPMWSQFRPMPPAYFSYWANDPWGNPDGEKMCYVTNHAHFPGNGPIVSAYYGAGSHADKYRALSPYMAARYCDFVEKRGAQFAPVLSKRLGGAPVRYVQSRREAFDAAVPQTYLTVRAGYTDDGTLVAVQSNNVHQTGARGGYGDKTHGHLVLPPNAQGFKQTVCPNVYSEMSYYVTNGACTTADPGQPLYEPVNLVFAKMADTLGMDVTDVIMKNIKVTEPSLSACMAAAKEAFGWDEKWHLAGQRTLEDGRLHGVSCRYAASQTWGMISYNINLRMGVDGKVYMPYAEALIGTYWPDAVQLVIAGRAGHEAGRRHRVLCAQLQQLAAGRRGRPRGHLHVGGQGGGHPAEAADAGHGCGRHGRDGRRGGPGGLHDHAQGRPHQADVHPGHGPAGRGLLRQAEGAVPDRRHPHHERGHVRGRRLTPKRAWWRYWTTWWRTTSARSSARRRRWAR